LLCFAEKERTVTGTDTRGVQCGTSTLAGYGGNDQGNALFEVYQLDRQNKKLFYTNRRI
jgi:hypothetical protein